MQVQMQSRVMRGAPLVQRGIMPKAPRVQRSIQNIPHAQAGQAPAEPIGLNVQDLMTKREHIVTTLPDESVNACLEKLVDNRIDGMPVVDDQGRVLGVVSDFDLIALSKVSPNVLFPTTDETWQAFKAVNLLVSKGKGKSVKEVMTKEPVTVRGSTNINDATSLLLTTKVRRLPVVDEEGKLIGLLSRANVVKAVLDMQKGQ